MGGRFYFMKLINGLTPWVAEAMIRRKRIRIPCIRCLNGFKIYWYSRKERDLPRRTEQVRNHLSKMHPELLELPFFEELVNLMFDYPITCLKQKT